MDTSTPRFARLNKQYEGILQGRTEISARNAPQFIEALCSQPVPTACIDKLISSKNGLKALQSAISVDLSANFCNTYASDFLQYVSSREIATVGGGDILRKLLRCVVDPPFILRAFITSLQARELTDRAELSLSWLLVQLMTLPGDLSSPFETLIDDSESLLDILLSSSQQDVRSNAEKIKLILDSRRLGVPVDAEFSPGGRHDNDKVDYREISILPTADEITSTKPPFLRRSDALKDPKSIETRMADYLDNHFRLLREDMIYELREETQSLLKKKTPNPRSTIIAGLQLRSVHHERPADNDKAKREHWAITLHALSGLSPLTSMPQGKRKSWLLDSKRFLKHRSMACIIIGNSLVALSTINRNEELIAQSPPVIMIHLEGQATVVKALLKLKAAENIKLVQINTALFAYEPVLKALQQMNTVPLSRELLYWTSTTTTSKSYIIPQDIIDRIRANRSKGLKEILQTASAIRLDDSQSSSLLLGLTETVSLIQGPPG